MMVPQKTGPDIEVDQVEKILSSKKRYQLSWKLIAHYVAAMLALKVGWAWN